VAHRHTARDVAYSAHARAISVETTL
jgi:hypothetical protein